MKDQTNTDERDSEAAGVKEKISDATEQIRETATHVAADAIDRSEHLIEMGKEKAHEAEEKGGMAVRDRAEKEKHRVATGLRTFADALRNGGEDLRGEGDQFRPLLTGTADRAERLSTFLESRDVDTLTSDIRHFANDHKALFAGSAFAAGFLGARFLKSSGKVKESTFDGSERRMAYDDGSRFDLSASETEDRYPRDFSSPFEAERAIYSADGGRQGEEYE